MTAQEARKITESKKMTKEEVLKSIASMAKSGNDYATFNIKKIKSPESLKSELEKDGFFITISEQYFDIKW